jgi:hypothetical protein
MSEFKTNEYAKQRVTQAEAQRVGGLNQEPGP